MLSDNQYLFVQVFLLLLLTKLILFFYKNRRILPFAWDQNGPTVPSFRQMNLLLRSDGFALFSKLKLCYGVPCNLWIGQNYNYVTDDAQEAKILLTSPHVQDKAKFYKEVAGYTFGDSVLFETYPNREVRKFLTRFFSPSLIRQCISNMNLKSAEALKDTKDLQNWDGIAKGGQVNFLRAFSENVLGISINEKDAVETIRNYINFQKIMLQRTIGRAIPFSIWKNVTRNGQKTRMIYEKCVRIMEKILSSSDVEPEKLIDAMQRGEGPKNLSNLEAKKNLSLLIAAGMDTSGLCFAYTGVLLGMNPNIQEILYKEVLDTVGKDKEITKEDLVRLKYTEAVILESLRIMCPLFAVGRQVKKDIDLGTKIVPKGSDIIVPIYLIHQNEKYWPNPEKFDPTRFLPENVAKIVPGSYLPFSMGPKDCLGKTYALTFLKIMLANTIRHYRFETNVKSYDEIKFKVYITMIPTNHVDVRLVPRSSYKK